MVQITTLEINKLQRCKNFTSELWATGRGGKAYLPYAFTEQVMYMLMNNIERNNKNG